MKKQQKIWLGIFLAMFILPELLWSPVENLVYDLLQNSNNVKIFRPNFLTVSDNTYLLLFVLLFQIIGLIGSLIIVFKEKINIWFKLLLILVLTTLLLTTSFIYYIVFSLRHGISF